MHKLKLLIVITLLAPSIAFSEYLHEPSNLERFLVTTNNHLEKHMSPKALETTLRLISELHCPVHKQTKLYVNPNHESKTTVVTLSESCSPSGFQQYPVIIVVLADRVSKLDIIQYGFMYDSGVIEYITDIDRDGFPELWLSGQICEPSPEDEQEYEGECDGGVTVEALNDKVELRKNKNGWKNN